MKSNLEKIADRLKQMELDGLTETDEYEKLSDDYQTLALAEVEEKIFSQLDDSDIFSDDSYATGVREGVRAAVLRLTEYWGHMGGVSDEGKAFEDSYNNLVSDPDFKQYFTTEEINFFKNR